MRVVKTWANAGSRSYRYHEPLLLPCVFGCQGFRDDLSHYVMCPMLFGMRQIIRPDTSPLPITRLGLHDPSRESLISLACVFSAYHAVRRLIKNLPQSPHEFNHPDLRRNIITTFIRVFCLEADNAHLACRSPQYEDVSCLICQEALTPP